MLNEEALSIINARRIINGPSDKLRAIQPIKYPWARDIWETMISNTWTQKEVKFDRDILDRAKLSEGQVLAYDRAIAFLSNLDAIQVTNIAENISVHITDPDIKKCFHRQIFEEALHVDAYSVMIESVCPDPMDIYMMAESNQVLKAKNDFVTAQADAIKKDGFTEENFVYALVSNIILEGVYFYSGFLTFYTIGRPGLMPGSVNNIKFIQRDEITHLKLFTNIFNELRRENPDIFTRNVIDKCYALFGAGANLEIAWGRHIIEGGVLGLTDGIINDYVQCRADECLVDINLNKLYGSTNPVKWVEKFSRVEKKDDNFFETKPTAYSMGTFSW